MPSTSIRQAIEATRGERARQRRRAARRRCPTPRAARTSLVLANILATPLKLLAPLLCAQLDAGGDARARRASSSARPTSCAAAYAPWIALDVGRARRRLDPARRHARSGDGPHGMIRAMSLATRCTACGTAFRVVQDQFKVSEGWVRCGRCNEVFNALEGLFDLERDVPHRLRASADDEPVDSDSPRAESPVHAARRCERIVVGLAVRRDPALSGLPPSRPSMRRWRAKVRRCCRT